MEDKKFPVTLTGPAKIDGVREKPGKRVYVTTALALQLAASGVINPPPFDVEDDAPLGSDFDQAVAAAAAKLAAETIDRTVATITAEKDAELTAAHDEVHGLQKQLVDVKRDAAAKLAEVESRVVSAESLAATAEQRAAEAEKKAAELEAVIAAGSRKK
ncbi:MULTISPECIES: hypothetical protein [unclassified Ensifer]|uniref:hypothetical protein n=1 Tax=unclassified Ensifer TaxID=2633371 RepID=UPI0008134916|nr:MULTISPECIES: hypothetical protein [unclassified Ensifer]OCP17378.1 hypothetical protein BC361_07920 [Ensifer sp. LC54]OCP28717.1 hypothetical protein BC363_02440 [Ensifer sp. LC384]